MRGRRVPRDEPEIVHGTVTVSGGGSIQIIGHASVEYPPDDEVLAFLGMV
jgi:hypothetical protein